MDIGKAKKAGEIASEIERAKKFYESISKDSQITISRWSSDLFMWKEDISISDEETLNIIKSAVQVKINKLTKQLEEY